MGAKIIPPNRNTPLVNAEGHAELRGATFFEEVSRVIEGLPNVADAVADVSTGSVDPEIIDLEDKINELLAALRTAGVIKT